jgi:p70 ribosomal S6 kinase
MLSLPCTHGSSAPNPTQRSSPAALSLLKALLTRDPALRLGSAASGGAAAIKGHAFFKPINWAKLEAREVESKFKPGVKCSLVRGLVGWRLGW